MADEVFRSGQKVSTDVSAVPIGVDQTANWAGAAAANTNVTITITRPPNPYKEHEVIVYNPSTDTDLSVKQMVVEASLGGAARDALLTTLSIPKAQTTSGTSVNTHRRAVNSLFTAGNAKLIFSNDSVATATFTATVRVREIS